MTKPTLIFGHAGIGGAVAKLLRGRGLPVHVVGRNQAALAELSSATGCTHSVCDVTQDNAVGAAVKEALHRFDGQLGGLVYAVGSIPIKSAKQDTVWGGVPCAVRALCEKLAVLHHREFATAAEMLDSFRVNTVGAFEAAKHSYAALSAADGGGSIVFYSTIAARRGFTNHSLISAAKGGVEGLTVALAAEYSPKVRVNCIAPSLMHTPLAGRMVANPKMAQSLAAMHPLGRLGQPDDGAELTAFLLGDGASWMSGQVLGLDGGRSTLVK